MYQVYENVREEMLATMVIRQFESPEERWRIRLWGTRSSDGGQNLPLWKRLYEKENYPVAPIIEGNVREAADKSLELAYKKWKPPLDGPHRRAPWLLLAPATEQEPLPHRGLLILGEQDGIPAMFATRVCRRLKDGPPNPPPIAWGPPTAQEGVWGVEFRPEANLVREYLPLSEARKAAAARLDTEDDVVIAVRPRRAYNHTAHMGWIHARIGDELRLEPMCWRGILDAPGPKQAAAAAAAQMSEWANGHPQAENVVGDVRMVYKPNVSELRQSEYVVWPDGSYEPYGGVDGLFINKFAPLRSQSRAYQKRTPTGANIAGPEL